MQFNGQAKRKNLQGDEKIKDGPDRNNLNRGRKKNVGPAQVITAEGIDYLVRSADGPICGDSKFNKFNNKNVSVEGTFVGPLLIVSSWNKVK